MNRGLVVKNNQKAEITPPTDPAWALLGAQADHARGATAFGAYVARRAENTRRAQGADLVSFIAFLEELRDRAAARGLAAAAVGDLGADPEAWRLVTPGFVEAYREWLLKQGYALATINRRLSTVKVYAKLANDAGGLDPEHTDKLIRIRGVRGYAWKEVRHVDEDRRARGLPTRVGAKKAQPVEISPAQAAQLKQQPNDTPQGRRDAVLMCLLLDHGLRCGEIAILQVENFKRGKLTFFRPKVGLIQTHDLSKDTQAALGRYLSLDQRAKSGPLLLGSKRGGGLAGTFGSRAITARVDYLGEQIGIAGLSAHDCRHDWATVAAAGGTPLDRLQDAGGWSSLAMPARYIRRAAVANHGVRLSRETEREAGTMEP